MKLPLPTLVPTPGRRLVAAVLSGALLAFALPTVFPIWGKTEILPGGALTVLAYFALVPLCWAIRDQRPRGALFTGFVAGVSYFSVAIWWIDVAMNTFGGIPNYLSIPILYLLIAYLSLNWGGACAIAVYTTRALGLPLWATLPPAWTALELLRSYLFSGYPWADIGYTLARDRLEVQWASLFGVYGLAFLVALSSAALFEILWPRREKARRVAALVFALGFAAPHLYGAVRLRTIARELATAPRLKMALVQGNIDQKIKNAGVTGGMMSPGQYRDFILGRFLPLTLAADREGAALIAWPEASFPGDLPSQPERFPSLGIPPLRAQLLLGGVTYGWQRGHRSLTNSAFALAPDLHVLGQYDKHHLVPFGEYVPLEKTLHLPLHAVVPDIGFFDPGADLSLFTLRAPTVVRYAPLICFDAIFPEIGVDAAREDPDFLVNLTNDAWYGFSSAPYQFLSIVTVRAVETGKAIARPANTGVSAFIDPAGRVVSQTKLGLVDSDDDSIGSDRAVPPVLLMGEVPLLHARTPYVVIGDGFAYLCATFAVAGLLVARRMGVRHGRG